LKKERKRKRGKAIPAGLRIPNAKREAIQADGRWKETRSCIAIKISCRGGWRSKPKEKEKKQKKARAMTTGKVHSKPEN